MTLHKSSSAFQVLLWGAFGSRKVRRIALFADMLKFYGYPYLGVVSELQEGASLTGEVTETGMLPFKFTPTVLTCNALQIQSDFAEVI